VARLHPARAALVGVALATAAWIVLVVAGFAVEGASCPDPNAWVSGVVGAACAAVATSGWALAIWAYSRSAGRPSGPWLAGAAGLYVATLGWAATVTGAVALQLVDVCEL
jgi:hypothetical protein